MLRSTGARTILALAIAAALSAPAAAGPVLPVGDQVLRDGTFTITEPIIVGPGSSLRIENATVYLDFPTTCPTRGTAGYCQPQIMVNGGKLEIVDSTIDTHLFDPDDLDSMYAIASVGGEFHFRDSVFRHVRIVGAQGDGLGPSTILDNTFVDGWQGLSFTRGSEAIVRGNLFDDLMFGVAVRDGRSFITDNVFRNIIQPVSGSTPFGRAIDVQSTLVGEKSHDTIVLIEGNTVVDSHQALLSLTNFETEIRDNVFRGNVVGSTIGITVGEDMFNRDLPVYEDNVLRGNETSLQFYTSGIRRTGPIEVTFPLRGNSFLDRGCLDVEIVSTAADVSLLIDATGNWWGSAAGPQAKSAACPATEGNVATDPWLSEAPAED